MTVFHIFILFSGTVLNSCKSTEPPAVHFHDRQVPAYPVISSFADEVGPVNLVLLDPDHNCAEIAGGTAGITSFNWAGELLRNGKVKQLFWVPAGQPPGIAVLPDDRILVFDWQELLSYFAAGVRGPVALSLDLALLGPDTGINPGPFLTEILQAIPDLRPGLVTVALSAESQSRAGPGWQWFIQVYRDLARIGRPFLETGTAVSHDPDPWHKAPAAVWSVFRENPPEPGNESATAMIKLRQDSWQAAGQLEQEFPDGRLLDLAKLAGWTLEQVWQQQESPAAAPVYLPGRAERGLAVRLVNGRQERGCLALYKGVLDFEKAARVAAITAGFFDPRYPPVSPGEKEQLEIEIAVFGEFKAMAKPENFCPGVDTLILETAGDRTLLQASLAMEKNMSCDQFLEAITRKAGLAPGAWKSDSIRFYRAATVFLRQPLHTGR